MTYGVYILICLILHSLDIVTGVLKGFVTGKPSSHTMSQGLAKKASLLATEGVGFVLTWGQQYVDLGITATIPVCQTICVFIAIMEVLSILENVNETSGGKLNWLLNHIKKEMKHNDDQEV